MERIAVLVASSPTSASAQRAFELARRLVDLGHQVTLGLMENAVLAATGPLGAGVKVMVLAPDLALRGQGADSVHAGCQVCEYGDLVDLLMEQSDRSLGVF